MSNWTYRRGQWIEQREYPVSPRAALAQDRLKKWAYQKRWQKFPSLGPVPSRWLDVGPAPTSLLAYASEAMTAYYLDSVAAMLNESTPLLKLLA